MNATVRQEGVGRRERPIRHVCKTEQRTAQVAGSVHDADDTELLHRIAAGASEALAALYDRHGRAAYTLACWVVSDPLEAEDVIQEAFLEIWRQAGQFDVSRGSARSWIYAIVRHRSVDACRRGRRRLTEPCEQLAEVIADRCVDVETEATRSVDGAQVRAAISGLPPAQRLAIELVYDAGLTHDEIAAQLGLPLGTVKGRLRLALSKLRAALVSEAPAVAVT